MADIICRWRNGTPQTVVELVNSLPHKIMPNEQFRLIMQSSVWGADFFRTPYQLACQLGLYYESDDGNYYPRFDHDITEQEAEEYLEFWMPRYYVPNPYVGKNGFNQIECPTYMLCELYKYAKNHPNCTYHEAYKAIFREDANNNTDIVKNYINNFSKVLRFDNNGRLSVTDTNPNEIFDFMDRNDKKSFFDNFTKNNRKQSYVKMLIVKDKVLKHFILSVVKYLNSIDKLNSIVPYSSIDKSPIKVSKKDCFSLTGMFIKTTIDDIRNRNFGIHRWFEDEFKLGEKTVYLSTQWNSTGDYQLTLDDFIKMIQCCYGYDYEYKYSDGEFQLWTKSFSSLLPLPLPLQTIYYGTPGSGKSRKVNKLVENVDKNYVVRTTFHPDSDYASFVGCYKPIMSLSKTYQIKKTLEELKVEAKDITSQPVGNKVSQIVEFVTKYASLLPKIVEEYDEVQSMQNLLNKHLGFSNETYLTYIVDYVNSNRRQESKISYQFAPQAFTRAYVKAWNKPSESVYLIIEEINRGNCAQIFGDIFQLLDRKDGVSEYPIDADNDLRDYLEKELGVGHEGIADGKLKLPANLNILATMNTSDQSLFPMDSAFKRRWSWQCVPIEYEETKRDGSENESYYFTINIDNKVYSWIDFLQVINDKIYKATDSEDKQMGNFFITHDVDENEFVDKVMFYLWNDVCKEEVRTKNNFFRNYIDDKKQEEKEFSFNDLFKNNRTELLLKFMEYIGIEPKSEE